MRLLAAEQYGVFHTRQAAVLHLDRNALRRWGRTGEIAKAGSHTWRIAGAPPNPRQRTLITVLDRGPDAALHLWSAAHLWGIPGFDLDPIHTVRHRPVDKRAGRGRHSSTLVPSHHVTSHLGIPVTTVPRTLFDLAGRVHQERAERLVEWALRHRYTSVVQLDAVLHDLEGRGRAGTVTMRAILDARRDPAYTPTDSNLELRFEKLLAAAGIGGFERQVLVGDNVGIVGRVDFHRRSPWVIAEIQSDLYHHSLRDRERDAVRLERLRAQGATVVEIAEADVWHRPAKVVSIIEAALDEGRTVSADRRSAVPPMSADGRPRSTA